MQYYRGHSSGKVFLEISSSLPLKLEAQFKKSRIFPMFFPKIVKGFDLLCLSQARICGLMRKGESSMLHARCSTIAYRRAWSPGSVARAMFSTYTSFHLPQQILWWNSLKLSTPFSGRSTTLGRCKFLGCCKGRSKLYHRSLWIHAIFQEVRIHQGNMERSIPSA